MAFWQHIIITNIYKMSDCTWGGKFQNLPDARSLSVYKQIEAHVANPDVHLRMTTWWSGWCSCTVS